MTSAGKSKMAVAVIVIMALALSGLITGAIGSAISGNDSLVPRPVPHIPPQKVFVSSEPTKDSHGIQDNKEHDAHGETDDSSHGSDDGHHDSGGMIGSEDGFVLTNTLLSSGIVSILLIILLYMATRRMTLIPSGIQNLMEAAIEALYEFVRGVAGEQNSRKFFPLIATIFLFVLANAWVGLLPIYPTLGFKDEAGDVVRHLLRPAGTDLNMPLALAIVSFVFVEFWALKLLGFSYLSKFLPTQNIRKGNWSQVPIDLFVGALELLSELIRILSFTFRLFGNMTAGEILLIMITYLVPFIAVLPFYGLEILVGAVQALIFAGLTLVFVVVAVTPHEGEEH